MIRDFGWIYCDSGSKEERRRPMNVHRLGMSLCGSNFEAQLGATSTNVTTRRATKAHREKMASALSVSKGMREYDSLVLDSILTQSEKSDVMKMLELEGENHYDEHYSFASTQMGIPRSNRPALSMSPISSQHDAMSEDSVLFYNRFAVLAGKEELKSNVNSGQIHSGQGFGDVSLFGKKELNGGTTTDAGADKSGPLDDLISVSAMTGGNEDRQGSGGGEPSALDT